MNVTKLQDKKGDCDDLVLEKRWDRLELSAYKTANEILGKPNKKHQDWFDENNVTLNLEEWNRAQALELATITRLRQLEVNF